MRKLSCISPMAIFLCIGCLVIGLFLCWAIPCNTKVDCTFHAVELQEDGSIVGEGEMRFAGKKSHYLLRNDVLHYQLFQILDLSFSNSLLHWKYSGATDYFDEGVTFEEKVLSYPSKNEGNISDVVIQTLTVSFPPEQDSCVVTFDDGTTKRMFYCSIRENNN